MRTVTTTAAKSRVRRALAKQGLRLVTPRSARTWQDLGLHTINDQNAVVDQHIDLTQLGRELLVLSHFEVIAQKEQAGA